MKSQGLDHVAIMVKDMDRAVETLSNLFQMNFKEIVEAGERLGVRLCVSVPDLQIELISVVDPVKAKSSEHGREFVEFAERVGEGLYRILLRVDDAEGVAADAERIGLRVGLKMEEKQLGGVLPHFKEVIFSRKEGLSSYGIGVIEWIGGKSNGNSEGV